MMIPSKSLLQKDGLPQPMASRSQATSRSQQSQEPQTQELPENAVNNVVHYLLTQAQTKRGIKRADILEVVGKVGNKKFKDLLSNAAKILVNVYGIKLVEVGHESAKYYILINQLPYNSQLGNIVWLQDEQKDQILLMIVLSLIFMNGGIVDEELMWSYLTQLDIVEGGSRTHPYFGDVHRLLKEEYMFQMYLEYNLVRDSDPQKHTVSWGERARREVSLSKILQFACDMYGAEPTEFANQYKEAQMASSGVP
ncbi:melanoma-associated antigen D2-like isoform X2 [Bacillus rossius redtenbacheri]|uniref:melanoma-associated antigen D2-like isoform X2 n=1 Tax=Bacillus rossius redtenbacheri TaxID=93214 RepID=UPI002FDE1C02